jgi:hypothetical protein
MSALFSQPDHTRESERMSTASRLVESRERRVIKAFLLVAGRAATGEKRKNWLARDREPRRRPD